MSKDDYVRFRCSEEFKDEVAKAALRHNERGNVSLYVEHLIRNDIAGNTKALEELQIEIDDLEICKTNAYEDKLKDYFYIRGMLTALYTCKAISEEDYRAKYDYIKELLNFKDET